MDTGRSDQGLFLKWWDDAWTAGLGSAPWSRAVDGLTPEQAAWSPPNAPGVQGVRHSIWQIVEHLIFWREHMLGRLDGAPPLARADLEARNFPVITERTEAAWADARRRFEESHRRVGEAVRVRFDEAAPMMELLPHDSYHVGQVCFVRAMLGLPPIA